MTPRAWSRRHEDRGAVAALVAMLLGVGLLLGMGALVVDTGQIYAERAQLQNGADAGALAVAQRCGGAGGCGSTVGSTAGGYANANANDGTSAVDLVCGTDTGGVLPACPASDPECAGTAPSGTNYVEVHTSTRQPNGSSLLPPEFGQVLLGSSYPGRTVHACARAAWGGPSAATGFALTISLCEWQADTVNGSLFAPAPGSGSILSLSSEHVVLLHTTTTATCPSGPAGSALPGGFGWLADPYGTCTTYVNTSGNYADNTGVPASKDCQTALQSARTQQQVLLIPVYDDLTGTGSTASFHLRGFASFVVTGYHLSGFSAASTLTGLLPCTGSSMCISGYFTQALIPASAVFGGPNLGATEAQLIG